MSKKSRDPETLAALSLLRKYIDRIESTEMEFGLNISPNEESLRLTQEESVLFREVLQSEPPYEFEA